MKTVTKKTYLTLLFIIGITSCFADFYKLDFIIKNQPDRQIVLGLVKGDNFIPVDTFMAKNELVQFWLPEETQIGVYRINMGHTGYAKVMNEDPQVFDFIFNKEDIIIETDFKSPEKSANIVRSAENKIWFSLKKRVKIIDSEISLLEQKLNEHKGEYNNEIIKIAQQYNLLQIERDLFIREFANRDTALLVEQLIKAQKTVILDGYLSEKERKEIFQKQYFDIVDFENEVLIYSQCYTDNIFYYLKSYNDLNFTHQQREEAYKDAVNIILANTNKNKEVYDFIVEYLIHGFEVLKMDNLVSYLSSK